MDVTKNIQRRAEPADDGDRLGCLLLHPVADRYRVVAPDHLPEIARCGELVVQATVDHQEGSPPRFLASSTSAPE